MKKTMVLLGFWFFGVLLTAGPALALTISAFDSADNLAQALVGSGVTISNVSYTGAATASGYFTGGTAAGLGFNSGIVLTTGAVDNLKGNSNTSSAISTEHGLPGDAYLTSLLGFGYTTNDAAILSFDFVSAGDSIFFNYIFGSDEYNEWVNSAYNDVFAFVFEGNNIALLPNGMPVTIDNVNNMSNSTFYNDNENNGAFDFEYDGFTDMLVASVAGLTAGQTYSIKLAIADAGDFALDSGVFLQAGSFSDTPTDPKATVPEPCTIILMGCGLVVLACSRKIKYKK